MMGDKAPRPDRFPTFFYQQFCDVVGHEVWQVVEEARINARIAKEVNCTFLDLIPKVERLTSFGDFKSISLCNVLYKVIAKVIMNRLKPLLKYIISEEQSGFILRRSNVEGIIIAHEAIHSIRKAKVQRILIKLDIRKDYDMVDQDFLFRVLERFGFSTHWINWVKACIDGLWIFVLVNGSLQGFFQSSKGLQQGNPLSPFLFILLVEVWEDIFNI